MQWLWDWLWAILWNALVYTVTGQWWRVGRQLDKVSEFFEAFWTEIKNRVKSAKQAAKDYAWDLYIAAKNLVNNLADELDDEVSWLKGYAFGLYVKAVNWINDQISAARTFASDLVTAAKTYASNLVSGVYAWARPYIDNAVALVRGLYAWVQPYKDLITSWLTSMKSVINWLRWQAWGLLQDFLADPLGFVLGWLIDPILGAINWWQTYGPLLANFVANQLPDLLNLLEVGYSLLMNFVNNPGDTVLDLIASKFVDWLLGLLADNW